MNTKKYLLAVFGLLLCGCGVYEPIEIVPDHIQTIRIEPFENNTQQIGLIADLTEELVNEFIKEGRLTVVSAPDADSTLKGTIVEYSKIPLSYDENFVVQEYKLTMIVNLKYYDNIQKVRLWEYTREDLLGGIEVWVKYYVGPDSAIPETEEEARDRLVEDVAEKILQRVVYGWE
jgi:outer membrane lipopolysaccharide assembly protein LptE/RlpB